MAKIKNVTPALRPCGSRLAPRSGGERDRLKMREVQQPWRRWYRTARWQRLRRAVLLRDLYVCQMTGVALIGRYPAGNSPVVDHIEPHRGDERLFWDASNLQALSKAAHDGQKQRDERRGGS